MRFDSLASEAILPFLHLTNYEHQPQTISKASIFNYNYKKVIAQQSLSKDRLDRTYFAFPKICRRSMTYISNGPL